MGGSSKSSTSQSSQATDNRQVITNTTSSYDLSNRSQNNSNNTSNLYDASSNITNTTTNYTTTDGGAVAGGLATAKEALDKMFGLSLAATNAATDQSLASYHYADGIFGSALDFAGQNDARMANAFERASRVQNEAIDQLQDAYADAQGTSKAQEKIVLAVLAVAGVGLLVAMKKG